MPKLNSITDDIISHVRADATKKNLVPVVLFASNLLQVEIALSISTIYPESFTSNSNLLDRVWGLALINYLQDLQKYNL
jgi:hypothetical protein